MRKIIAHIHSDSKFLKNTNLFESKFFENKIFFVGNNKLTSNDNVVFLENNSKVYSKLIALCENVDFVVLYDLDIIKVKIALALPKNVRIAWRFFGYELYQKRPDLFKSKLSRKHDILSTPLKLRKNVSAIKQFLTQGHTNTQLFTKAVRRIDCFLALSEEEYNFLKNIWPNLSSTFIKLPHYHLDTAFTPIDVENKKTEKPVIIIGNNRSSYNNHLDIIKLIDKYSTNKNYNFTLLFNYGRLTEYSNEVIHQIFGKPYYSVIEDFMPTSDFMDFYKSATALVINGYRQMAGANIGMAFRNGTKVYLNNKNVHKKFLTNQGFKVFSLDDFEQDLKLDQLYFDKETAIHNFENFRRFKQNYTKQDFQGEVLKYLMESDSNNPS